LSRFFSYVQHISTWFNRFYFSPFIILGTISVLSLLRPYWMAPEVIKGEACGGACVHGDLDEAATKEITRFSKFRYGSVGGRLYAPLWDGWSVIVAHGMYNI
jgi:hypothetical protein